MKHLQEWVTRSVNNVLDVFLFCSCCHAPAHPIISTLPSAGLNLPSTCNVMHILLLIVHSGQFHFMYHLVYTTWTARVQHFAAQSMRAGSR
jgi:hypothetical protein